MDFEMSTLVDPNKRPKSTQRSLSVNGKSKGSSSASSTAAAVGAKEANGPPLVPEFFAQNKVDDRVEKLAQFNYQDLSFWGNFLIALNYVISDTKKQKRSFAIGVVTVFLVVCFISLIQNSLDRSSVIFVKLAEDQVGQYDFLMSPTSTSSGFLNYTALNTSLSKVEQLVGAAPRWLLLADVYNPENPSLSSPSILMIFDSELEEFLGLGTGWPHRALGSNEIHATDSIVRKLGLKPQMGQKASIKIDPLSFLSGLGTFPEGADINDILSSIIMDAAPDLDLGQVLGDLADLAETLPGNTTVTIGNTTIGIDIWQLLGINSTELSNNLKDLGANATLSDILDVLINNNTVPESTFIYDEEYTVVDAISVPSGKYPALLGNVVVLEKKYFEREIKRFVESILDNPVISQLLPQAGIDLEAIRQLVRDFQLQEYSLMVISMLKERFPFYVKESTVRQTELLGITDSIFLAIGLDYPVTITTPVESGVQTTNFISLFLNQIFIAVIGVLVLLAIMLIYSLLLSDVEEKTFEYGMLRTLGMPKVVLIILLCIQALYFAAPGIVLGFLICFIIYVPMDFALSTFVFTAMDPVIHGPAIGLGLGLGLILPFVGMLLPIRKALSRTLRDALDIYHNSSYDSVVKIEKLESLGVSPTESFIAVLLVVLGFIVYYLVPLSFLFNNLTMFLTILTFILLGMVIGQVLLTQAVDYFLEKFFVWCLMWGSDRKLVHIVIKNLAGHRTRNKKTATMFTLCLGFVIFAATMFVLQATSIPQNLQWIYGSDVAAITFRYSDPLPEEDLRAYLNPLLTSNSYPAGSRQALDAIVLNYTFTTFPIQHSELIENCYLSAASSIRSRSVVMYGVEENFLDVAFEEFMIIEEVAPDVSFPTTKLGKPDLVRGLYRNDFSTNETDPSASTTPESLIVYPVDQGTQRAADEDYQESTSGLYSSTIPVIISASLQNGAYIDLATKMRAAIVYRHQLDTSRTQQEQLFQMVKPVAMARKFPSFTGYNSFQVNGSPMLLRMEHYQRIVEEVHARSNNSAVELPPRPPKQSLLVRVTANASAIQIEGLVNGINSFIKNEQGQVINLRDQVSQTELASSLIILFFDVVAVVGLIFSFFVLWLSFTANVRENSWEYGVLRAVGLTSTTVGRLYIYEAMALVMSTIVLGSGLGIFTAVVLTLQINLFSELPFVFNFPTELFVVVIVLSMVISVVGSHLPAEEFRKKEIAIALRG